MEDYSIKKTWESIDCIYVIGHVKYEEKRVKRVLQQLAELQCPGEKVKVCAPTWGKTLTNEQCFNVYDPWLPRNFPCFVFKSRGLSKGEISLNLNFHSAVMDAAQKQYKTIMVLESDVMFRNDFRDRFPILMKKAAAVEYDYISLSDGTGTHNGPCTLQNIHTRPQELYPGKMPFPFRCTDSMIFNQKFIGFLAQHLLPFRDCLDWELNFRILEFQGKAFWAEPHLIEQASLKRVEGSILEAE